MALYIEHYELMMSFHGTEFGVRIARKHLGWMMGRLLEQQAVSIETSNLFQAKLMKALEPDQVLVHLNELSKAVSEQSERCAA